MRHALYLTVLLALAVPAHAQNDIPLQDAPLHDPSAMTEGTPIEPDLSTLSDLFPNGAPNLLTLDSFATSYRLPASVRPPDAKQKLPTKIDYSEGPLKWDLETSITTRTTHTSIIPPMPDPNVQAGAAGGSGNLKGRVSYIAEQWEFYSSRNLGVTQADGVSPTLQESTTFGSLYKLPDWMNGGKIGASLELLPTDERKTRVEYRRSFGPAEGYVAAEQTFAPHQNDLKAPTTVRGGVTRKF